MSKLNLSEFIDSISIRSSETLRVDERLTYHFESANIGRAHWDCLAHSLSEFYAMCGQSNARPHSLRSLIYTTHSPLPVHNPIAFFHGLSESDKTKNALCRIYRKLLPYAMSGSGIVFGTAFDREGIHTVRPCDMEYITPFFPDPNIYTNLIYNQAQLTSGHRFKSDLAQYTKAVMALDSQRAQILEWHTDWENEHAKKADRPPFSRPLPWSGDLNNLSHWEEMFFSFLDVYENYCTSQAPESSPAQANACKQILHDIRLSAQFVFQMERITIPLLTALKIEAPEQNYTHRKQWIENARAALLSENAVSQLDALKRCFQDNFDALTNTNHLFTHISSNSILTPNQHTIYPLLNERVVLKRLTLKEKQDLFWYRNLPVSHWIEQVCSPSTKLSLRKIFPFYICYFFWNKEKPLRPFNRFNSRFSPRSLSFDSGIAFSAHAHAVRLQTSHHQFYLDLITWCKKYYPDEADLSLCHALYTFYRPHLVTESPSPENHFLPNHLYVVYQGLLRLFDFPVSMLPQYTDTPITGNEFNYFLYVDPSKGVREIRKHIHGLITSELAVTYRKLAFLDPDGFGHSYFPKQWHQNLAAWLSEIIDKDSTLAAHVSCGGANLAQIELAIQFLCCQQLQDISAKEILLRYKRTLSPN